MRGLRPEPPDRPEHDDEGTVEYTVNFTYGTVMTPAGPVNVMPIRNIVRFLYEVSEQVDDDESAPAVLRDIAANFSRFI